MVGPKETDAKSDFLMKQRPQARMLDLTRSMSQLKALRRKPAVDQHWPSRDARGSRLREDGDCHRGRRMIKQARHAGTHGVCEPPHVSEDAD